MTRLPDISPIGPRRDLRRSLHAVVAAGAALSLCACVAFDLGPETESARAANIATPFYPRLADVPTEPADMHCLRAALAEQAETVASGSSATRDALRVFEAPRPAPVSAPATVQSSQPTLPMRYRDLYAGARDLARMAQGRPLQPVVVQTQAARVACPPTALDEAQRLAEAREWLVRGAEEVRAARPAAPDAAIVLPPDMGQVVAPGEGPEAAR